MTTKLTPHEAIEEARRLFDHAGLYDYHAFKYHLLGILDRVEEENSVLSYTYACGCRLWANGTLDVCGLHRKEVLPQDKRDPHPDTEADGVVFCGKCGESTKVEP